MSEKRELTRAEIARQRRAQRAAKELRQTSQRAVKPAVQIVPRKPKTVSSAGNRLLTNRRRFDAALGLQDIQLHKPVMRLPQLGLNWRLASFSIALLLTTAIYLALTLPYFHIPAITALGNNRLSREEIEAVLGVSGQSIFTVQPDVLTTRLKMNYPELASVEVKTYLPNYVYVTVVERQPVIAWQQGGAFTWIDSAGVAFRPRGTANGLVSVSGLSVPPAGVSAPGDLLTPLPFMQKELVDAILALAPLVPVDSTLTFDSADGLGWRDNRGWDVVFGTSANDMPLKIRVYQSLVDSLMARGKFPEFISVVYPDAPYYRMSKYQFQDATINDGQ